MSAISDLSHDDPKPTGERLVLSKPSRRTTSFIVQSNPLDERHASNLSLPTIANSILKSPNSSRQRERMSSHLRVHYTPMTTADEEEIEWLPPLVAPTIPPSKNTPRKHRRFRLFPSKPTWSNLFAVGRYEKFCFRLNRRSSVNFVLSIVCN